MRYLAPLLILTAPFAAYWCGYRDGQRTATQSPPFTQAADPLGAAHPDWRDYDAAGGRATLDPLTARPAPTPRVHLPNSITF